MPTKDENPADSTSDTNDPATFDLHDAYSVETPADNVELYRRWAATYEDDFMASHGYICHVGIAEIFADVATPEDGPVLDVGCGTGVVASEISRLGRWPFDGLDISAEMLERASSKLNLAGAPVYGGLLQADLTKPLKIESATYGAVVSAGTFTTGHVGPEAIEELARIVRPGGLLVLGVNTRFYEAASFDSYLDGLNGRGLVDPPVHRMVPIYDRSDHEHAADVAHVLIIRTPGDRPA